MHLYIWFPMTLLYLRKHHGDEMPFVFLVFFLVLRSSEMKQNLTLSLNDKLCQLLLVMPNYDFNV